MLHTFTFVKSTYDLAVSVLSIFLNLLMIFVIGRTRFEPKGYRLFLLCLASTDLYLGLVNISSLSSQAFLSNLYNSGQLKHCNFQMIIRNFQLTGFLANLLSLLAMSTDHYIGIVSLDGF